MVANPLPAVNTKILRRVLRDHIQSTRAILSLPGLTASELRRHLESITTAQITRFKLRDI